jgi:hypothetical protein
MQHHISITTSQRAPSFREIFGHPKRVRVNHKGVSLSLGVGGGGMRR